jgi:hypothetical protein
VNAKQFVPELACLATGHPASSCLGS